VFNQKKEPDFLKCVFKKEDKKDREVRGSVALSSGMYAFKYMTGAKAS